MAIFTNGPIIGSISGSIGGQTFVKAPRANVLRPRRRLTNVDNKRQIKARATYICKVRRWAAINDSTKTAWRTAAAQLPIPNRLGTKRNLTGFQLFLKHFDNAIIDPATGYELPPIFAAGTPPAVSSIVVLAGSSIAGTYQATTASTTYDDIQWRISRPYSATAPHQWRNWVLGSTVPYTGPGTYNWIVAYTDLGYSPFQAGEAYAMQFRFTGGAIATLWTHRQAFAVS